MNQVANLLDRPKFYHNIDGVGELGVGFMCLAYALLGWEQVHSPEGSFWNQMYTLYLYVGLMVAIIHFGTKAIKQRITYPRTGAVVYRKRDTVWIPLLISLPASAAMSAAFYFAVRSHFSLTTPFSLVGLILAASYARGFARTVRWKWAVMWTMVFASVAIALLPAHVIAVLAAHSWITKMIPANVVGAVWLSMTIYGALLMLSGGTSFWIYLHSTEVPGQEQ